MFLNNLLKSGWVHALFIAFIAYPSGAIVQKLIANSVECHTLVYTATFMLSSACALLFVAGPGHLTLATLRRPETWLYSILQICVITFGILIMKYVSATEGSALYRVTAFFTVILSFLFLHQRINKFEFLGISSILAGFYFIVSNANISVENKAYLTLFVIGSALTQGCQKLITETHKTNRKAKDFKSQIRVAGLVMAVAGAGLLFTLLFIAYFKSQYTLSLFHAFPEYKDFYSLHAYALAVLMGIFIVSISKYCEFYAIKTIGAKYLISLTSLQIIVVYGVEHILVNYNIVDRIDLRTSDVIALVLLLGGNLAISFSGFLKNLKFIKRGEIRNTLANMDDNFIDDEGDFEITKLNLANLMSLYHDNVSELAEDIDINKVTLENIYNYDFEEFKLERKIAKKINTFASKNVSLKDKLTRAHNRYSLSYKFNELLKKELEFKLYLLDLNKFKPINDTYGHEAGDKVLIETTARLNSIEEFKDNVFRIGGDEFVLIQINNINEDLSDKITDIVSQPINYNDICLEISTSVGFASSSESTDLKTILATADDNMYQHKNGRER